MSVDRKDKRFSDFMCSCGEERMQKCDKVYEDVKASFSKEFNREVTDKEIVNLIVYGLANLDNGQAEIVGIPSDMWSAISVEYIYDFSECEKDCDDDDTCEYPKCGYKIQQFWIECDRIYHGLARAYQLVKEFDGSVAQG